MLDPQQRIMLEARTLKQLRCQLNVLQAMYLTSLVVG